jgi:hypothetical protein
MRCIIKDIRLGRPNQKRKFKRVESSNLLILKLKGQTFAGAGACQPPLPPPLTSCCIKLIKKKQNKL